MMKRRRGKNTDATPKCIVFCWNINVFRTANGVTGMWMRVIVSNAIRACTNVRAILDNSVAFKIVEEKYVRQLNSFKKALRL